MSKRKYFGRFTAMSLAGISAISSMAIVASAEAYPTSVYEFTYNGITATPMYYSAQSATSNNDYVTTDLAKGAVKGLDDNGGFKVANLEGELDNGVAVDFDLTSGIVNCANGTSDTDWCYTKPYAFAAGGEAIVLDDYIENRGTSKGMTFYFKSKAERDAVVNTITGKNKAEYTAKYTAALNALTKDLTAANTALYNEEIRLAQEAYDSEIKSADSVYNATVEGLAKDDKDGLTAAKEALASAKKAASETLTAAKNLANDKKIKREEIKTNALAEFKEAYAPENWAFGNKEDDPDSETAVFVVKDSSPAVVFGGHTGQFISGEGTTVTYNGPFDAGLELSESYYRTVGAYVSSTSYAFAGEILHKADRQDASLIGACLLDSNRWSSFSAVIEGKPSDNENTTEDNKTNNNDKDEKTSWYPDSAAYRVANTNNISYKGENGYWYTSSAAAEVYGGGYAKESKTSNYSSVKGKAAIYFNAISGYYSTEHNSYSYLVETNEVKKEEEKNNIYTDPYYYYFLMSQNGGYNTNTTDPSAPTIYGSKKQAGWTKILNRVKSTKNGTVTIDMNGASTIPSDVVKAAAANNTTIKAVNENGSIFTVKGSDVSYATSIDTTVKYNVKVVTDTLKAKAIKLNKGAISTTQLVISDEGSLGTDATVTVKLSSKRAGCTVKAYRASNNGKKMTLEAKGTVQSNGSLSLNLDNGGNYVLVVIE